MPEPDCFLRYRISAATRNFTYRENHAYTYWRGPIDAAARRGFKMVLLPRDAMHKRGLCRHAVSVCPSVCLSVCVSVTFVNCVKTNKDIIKKFSSSSRSIILVFLCLTGASNAGGVGRNRDSEAGFSACY